MIALLESYRSGLLDKNHLLNNIVSGVIVGVVALPLAMAFAIASGAKPEQGLYTAILAGFIVSIFGGTRLQIAGPTGAFIVILAGISAKHGVDGLQIATIMAGIILLLFGLSKLGSIIKYIPDPVILGFTSGIAVIIWVGQWQYFFGLAKVSGNYFHTKIYSLIQALPTFQVASTLLAISTLLIVIYLPKLPRLKKIPAPLIALIITTSLQSIYHFDGVQTIGSTFGGLSASLPNLHLPTVTFKQIIELIGPAFAIAMLGAIESLLSAVVADGMTGTRHNSNQELIGQGIANVITPLFGGIAATGAIARTATNIRNGGTSPLAGIVHSITLLLIILLLAPLAVNVPLPSLAGILFVVAWNMSEAKHFLKMIKRAPRADVTILLITFSLTVFADLVVAINIGVILATFQFLRKMSSNVEVRSLSATELKRELAIHGFSELPPEVIVYTMEGPFFFGAVENFERALASTHTDPKILILRLRWVPFIDITGLQTLEEVIVDLHKRGVRVILCGANELVLKKLKKSEIFELIGNENNFETFSDTMQHLLTKK